MTGPLELVGLSPLMARSSGRPEVAIGLIDGPVAIGHPDLVGQRIYEVRGKVRAMCSRTSSIACTHGTFVAGMLCAKRSSIAPAICSACTLFVRPIFSEELVASGHMPSATPEELADAILDIVKVGVRVINLSAAMTGISPKGEHYLLEVLDYTARRGVIIVAAAGNQGTLGGSTLTRHSAVIPVASCDLVGRPLSESNLGLSIGRQGLSAPGLNITSLGADGRPRSFTGSSAAAPFVTGAIALLWSEFPATSVTQIKVALTRTSRGHPKTVVPRVLDAWGAHQVLRFGEASCGSQR